jgi:hypothetical protein
VNCLQGNYGLSVDCAMHRDGPNGHKGVGKYHDLSVCRRHTQVSIDVEPLLGPMVTLQN